MTSERTKTFPLPVHLPRSLDLKKFTEARAPELSSLFSVVARRLHNDFTSRRNERRRTTSHNNRVAKRRGRKYPKSQQIDESVQCETNGDKIELSRRVRRRLEFKRNPKMGFCTKRDGTRLLRTHLWHVKRFKMAKQWGFCLPMGLLGSGRGSRAVLKMLKRGALLHDASYSCVVQLEGSMDSLSSLLKMILAPFPASSEQMQSIICGFRYGNAMLHHIGAPYSQLIAPVTYIWRPLHQMKANDDGSCQYNSSLRQLWIMVHVAAFNEAVDTLRVACQKVMLDNGQNVEISSRSEQLAKLEIIGHKSSQILEQVMHPVSISTGLEEKSDARIPMSLILKHLDELPSQTILSLLVHDPRVLPLKDATTDVTKSSQECDNTQSISELHVGPEKQSDQLSYADDLWISDMITPPLEDGSICLRKHQRRLAFYYLDKQEPGSGLVETKNFDQSCPILLLKNNGYSFSFSWWSIILPISWVRPFWISFVNRGTHAIGLQERQWVARDDGVPNFPYDFPDCKVYSHLKADEDTAFNQKNQLYLPSFRAVKGSNLLLSWDCMTSSIRDWSSTWKDDQKCLSPNDTSVLCQCSFVDENESSSTIGHVIRTGRVLNDYINELRGNNILLFPNLPASKKCFLDLIADQRVRQLLEESWQHPVDRKFSFLRVLLQAYRDGSFEQGAPVFAPLPSDLSIWMSKSDETLQIPQSEIKNCFDGGDSVSWTEQVSDNPTSQSWQRQLIGFVTSGFVRGSGRPSASALCETLLLAKLRHEQWSSMQENGKLEVLVLVRNLRSTAYRLALATIVLEKQEDDVAYM